MKRRKSRRLHYVFLMVIVIIACVLIVSIFTTRGKTYFVDEVNSSYYGEKLNIVGVYFDESFTSHYGCIPEHMGRCGFPPKILKGNGKYIEIVGNLSKEDGRKAILAYGELVKGDYNEDKLYLESYISLGNYTQNPLVVNLRMNELFGCRIWHSKEFSYVWKNGEFYFGESISTVKDTKTIYTNTTHYYLKLMVSPNGKIVKEVNEINFKPTCDLPVQATS